MRLIEPGDIQFEPLLMSIPYYLNQFLNADDRMNFVNAINSINSINQNQQQSNTLVDLAEELRHCGYSIGICQDCGAITLYEGMESRCMNPRMCGKKKMYKDITWSCHDEFELELVRLVKHINAITNDTD